MATTGGNVLYFSFYHDPDKNDVNESAVHFSGFETPSRPVSQVFQHPPRQFAKRSSASGLRSGLEKRPTFVDGLDKRKSWSVDIRQLNDEATTATPFNLRNARGQTLHEVQQHQQQQQRPLLSTTTKG
jgi:hypothetical protein